MTTPAAYRLTDSETKREALGRGFALVGSLVGVVGTAMLLSVNPAVKAAAGSAYRRLPASSERSKVIGLVLIAGLLMAGGGAVYMRKLRGQ